MMQQKVEIYPIVLLNDQFFQEIKDSKQANEPSLLIEMNHFHAH